MSLYLNTINSSYIAHNVKQQHSGVLEIVKVLSWTVESICMFGSLCAVCIENKSFVKIKLVAENLLEQHPNRYGRCPPPFIVQPYLQGF